MPNVPIRHIPAPVPAPVGSAPTPSLREIAATIANAFCMVAIAGGDAWRSGHYALTLNEPAGELLLRQRGGERGRYQLRARRHADGQLEVTVRGSLSQRAYEDLAAADRQLGGCLFRANCLIQVGRQRVTSRLAYGRVPQDAA